MAAPFQRLASSTPPGFLFARLLWRRWCGRTALVLTASSRGGVTMRRGFPAGLVCAARWQASSLLLASGLLWRNTATDERSERTRRLAPFEASSSCVVPHARRAPFGLCVARTFAKRVRRATWRFPFRCVVRAPEVLRSPADPPARVFLLSTCPRVACPHVAYMPDASHARARTRVPARVACVN